MRLLPALALLWLLPGLARAADVSWSYRVTLADAEVGGLDIEWTLLGLSGEVRVCPDMARADRGVISIEQAEPRKPLARDGNCWLARAPDKGPLRLRYRYDLAGMAGLTGDPDYVSRVDDSYVFNDEAVLLRPDPLPRNAPITVEFQLPDGLTVATPWERLDGPGLRFRYDSEHYDAGSYVALGRLRFLSEVKVKGGTGTLSVLDRPRKVSDEQLRAWIQRALGWVADFYGGLPGGRVHIVLVPVDSDRPGVFGTVLRRGPPSVVLYFGGRAKETAFRDDWVAPHELFHLGNPSIEGRIPWFIEGFTTYYQDVLLGRAGAVSPTATFGDLHDGLRRFCQPDGMSLGEESEALRRTYRYTRVYWGGACLAFRLDVAIRQQGRRDGLDGVLRDLRRRGQGKPLSEEEIIQALDRAAGAPLTREHLHSRTPIPLEGLYRDLGIEPTGPESVRLRDDAPLSSIRKSIVPGR
ncbi:MAG TPA: hypothetical protein VK447_11860 [Myxococcaceae bacterium]|nr:hypothetical protein [Myxococcaceae bacterium]